MPCQHADMAHTPTHITPYVNLFPQYENIYKKKKRKKNEIPETEFKISCSLTIDFKLYLKETRKSQLKNPVRSQNAVQKSPLTINKKNHLKKKGK